MKKKASKKKIRKRKTFLKNVVFVFSIILLISGFFLVFRNFMLVDIQTYKMDVVVDNNVTGFNLDQDALHFGRVRPKGRIERGLVIKNTQSKRRVVVETSGEFSEWLSYQKSFILEPEEEKEIPFTLVVPEDAVEKDYAGEIKLFFYRCLFK